VVDLLEQGSRWLDRQRRKSMAREVVYSRGSASVTLLATIGRTEFEQTDQYGVVHRIESRDYLVTAEDLVLDGQLTTPKAGDQIRESDGAVTRVYAVLAPGDEPPWRWSDPYRVTLRIHTKSIGDE